MVEGGGEVLVLRSAPTKIPLDVEIGMKRIFTHLLIAMFLLLGLGDHSTGAKSTGLAQGNPEQSNKEQANPEQANKEQTANVLTAPPNLSLATLRRDFKSSFPIPAGEKLEYEIKFSRFPIYASVGVITFENLGEVANPPATNASNGSNASNAPGVPGEPGVSAAKDQYPGKPPEPLIQGSHVEFRPAPNDQILRLRATAVSKGMLIALFGIDVRDRFETLVDLRDFSARISLKETKEGKKHTIQTAFFDTADQQVKYTTSDLNNPQAPLRLKPLPRLDGMSSLLSAFYFVRLQKLKEGQTLVFPVSTDEANYQFEILVGKRESIKTECGKVKTVRIEPKIFGPGRLISRQGEMTLWLSDDSKHAPLQAVAKTSSGTVTAKLLNFKDKCNILDPEVGEKPKAKKSQ
jgi:hypothetical protein